jgi:hypothetical protein
MIDNARAARLSSIVFLFLVGCVFFCGGGVGGGVDVACCCFSFFFVFLVVDLVLVLIQQFQMFY